MRRLGLAAILAAALLLGCEPRPQPRGLIARAELGVFFGGQIQEREELPFSAGPSKLVHGFRIDFTRPLARPVEVRWEIDMPDPAGRGRVTQLAGATARAGAERFEQTLAFRPGDRLGTWNYRVLVDGELAIDRPVLVYDAAARKRAAKEASAADRQP